MLITVTLQALTGSFQTDFDRAAKTAEKRSKDMQRAFDQFSSTMIKRLAVIAGPAALGLLVKQAIDTADAFSLLAQKTGISTETLSELDYAAKQSGIEDLGEHLIKFNKNIAEATQGSKEQLAAFKALGITQEDLQRSSPEELLSRVSDELSGYADGAQKGAIAQALFNKTGSDLIPLLNQGAEGIEKLKEEGRKLGQTIGTDTANAANDFNDALDKIKASVQGVARQVVTDLAPRMKEFADFMSDPATIDSLATFGEALVTSLGAAVTTVTALTSGISRLYGFIVDAPTNLVDVLDEIADLEKQIADSAKDEGGFDFLNDLSPQRLEEAKKRLEELVAQRDKLFDKQRASLTGPGAPAPDKPPPPIIDPNAEANAKKAADALRRLQEAIARGAAEVFQAQQDREKAILEASLNARLISYDDYLAEKLRITEAEIDQEIEASKGLLENATEDEAALLRARIEALEVRREIAQVENADEEAQHVHEIALAYDQAATAARNYLDQIRRQNDQDIAAFDMSPAQRRYAAGANDVQESYRAAQEQLDAQLEAGQVLDEEYSRRSELLKSTHDEELAEWDRYYAAIEAKQADFSTGFRGVFDEYLDSTKNLGEALANDLVGAIDSAVSATADLAAQAILWGEGGEEAAKAIARSIITDLVSSLIKVGLQMAVNFALSKAFGAAGTTAAVSEAGAVAAAWAPAAIGASIATFGAASAAGLTSYLSSLAVGEAATLAVGAFEKGGLVSGGKQLVQINENGEEFVVNAQATRQNRGLLEAINDGANVSPTGGGGGIQIINNAPGITITPRGRTLTVDMLPDLMDLFDSDQASRADSQLGKNFRATANKLGTQPSSNR